MRVALGGEQPVPGVQILLKDRNAERVPKRFAIGRSELFSSGIGEDHHRLFDWPAIVRYGEQLFQASSDASWVKSLSFFAPALRKYAH